MCSTRRADVTVASFTGDEPKARISINLEPWRFVFLVLGGAATLITISVMLGAKIGNAQIDARWEEKREARVQAMIDSSIERCKLAASLEHMASNSDMDKRVSRIENQINEIYAISVALWEKINDGQPRPLPRYEPTRRPGD